MNYDVRIEEVSSRPLAIVRRRAGLQEIPRVVPEACGTVWSVIKALDRRDGGRHVAVYLDDQINIEVGVEITLPFVAHGEVIPSATPAGIVATALHLGPYQRLPQAHMAIRQWCADHGHRRAGPNWEIYDHWKDEWNDHPTDIRTEIYYLLKPDGGTSG